MGGLVDFFLYSITDSIMDYKLYGLRFFKSRIYKIAYRFFLHKQDDRSAPSGRTTCSRRRPPSAIPPP